MHTVTAQLLRLAVLRDFPASHTDDAFKARESLRRALESAGSLTDATHLVDEILRRCRVCPNPEVIYGLATEIRSGAVKPTRDGCSVCNGMGWQIVPGRGVVRCACMPPEEKGADHAA